MTVASDWGGDAQRMRVRPAVDGSVEALFHDGGVDGVVQLRGEVSSPDMIRDLETKTRKVTGVRDVENLLHVHGQPAPMHQ